MPRTTVFGQAVGPDECKATGHAGCSERKHALDSILELENGLSVSKAHPRDRHGSGHVRRTAECSALWLKTDAKLG